MRNAVTPFERIRQTNETGNEFWSSRDFAQVLGYADYRNFEAVVERARTACFNSGVPVADHFGEVTEMIGIGKGAQRPVKTVMMSRYACYLVIQNADPAKAIVAIGQAYFAIQTRRQELSDQEVEAQRRALIRRDQDQTRLRELLLAGVESAPGPTADAAWFDGLRKGVQRLAGGAAGKSTSSADTSTT